MLAFKLDVDPLAADTYVRVSVRQQDDMPWFMVEMFQHRADTDFTCGSTGFDGNFQYFAERADGISGDFSCLVPACVRHYDDPQRVSPTRVAVGRKYAEDTLGDCVRLVARRYDDANTLDCRRNIQMAARVKIRITNRIAKCASIYYQK
jgi:hypothetical protein